MYRHAFTTSILLLVGLAVSCSSGGNTGKPCLSDAQCETGQICGTGRTCETVTCTSRVQCPGASTCLATGVCGPEECASTTDCGADQICKDRACFPAAALPACGDGGVCANGKVCNSSNNRCEDCSNSNPALRCPTGQLCQSGSCVASQIPCNNDSPCLPAGKVCDIQNNVCVACSDTRPCPASHTCESGVCQARPRCDAGGQCPSGLTCDTTTQYCIAAGTVPLCGPCTVDAECQGTGAQCLAFAGGSFCGQDCSSAACPTGFVCAPQFNQCAPAASRCQDNCVITGCSGGRTCDVDTGLCLAAKSLCDACATDDECGATSDRCLAGGDGGSRFCSQNCDTTQIGGRLCPAGFTCREIESGVKQCLPTSGECVLDPCANVQCNPASTEPWCNPATRTCVQCLEDFHCGSDQTCQNNVCVTPGACTGDASCAGDPSGSRCCNTTLGMQCRQCCDNSHCPQSAPYCVANTCQANQDPCAGVVCNPPQTCNPANGQCEGGGSVTNCTSDADCGAGLACDPVFGFCYDNVLGLCSSDDQCAPGQTCNGWCTGCLNTLLYCSPGLFCIPIPGADICFPSGS